MKDKYYEPLYPIGIASRLIGVSSATLRIWESKGLIKPTRLGKDRYYSDCDIDHLNYIKHLLQDEGVNIAGVKNMMESISCWDVKNCPEEVRRNCDVYKKYTKELGNLKDKSVA